MHKTTGGRQLAFQDKNKKHALVDIRSAGIGAQALVIQQKRQEKSWRMSPLQDICIDLNGWNAELYLFRCNNTNLCGLFCNDKTKKIPKNALHVWLPELHCKHTVFSISSDSQEQNYCCLGPLRIELEQLFKMEMFYGTTEYKGIMQDIKGEKGYLPHVLISAVLAFSCENKWYKLVIKWQFMSISFVFMSQLCY